MSNIEENKYSDQENTWAAQMAYCNIDDTVITSTLLWARDNNIIIENGGTYI